MLIKTQVIEALSKVLDDGDEVDRCYAAQALGQLQDSRSIEVLFRHLHDEDLDVCVDAASALGDIGDEEAVQGLIDALYHHSDPDVKQAALDGLSRCGGAQALATMQNLLDRPVDMQWCEMEGWDDWWDLQLQAVKTLGEHRVVEAVPALADLLDSEDGQDIESEVLKALVQIGPAGIAQLRKRLEGAQPRRLRRIAKALCHASSSDASELLTELLNSPDVDVRLASVDALAYGHAPDRLSILIRLLNDDTAAVQVEALNKLAGFKLQGNEGLNESQWLELLAAPDSQVRCAALRMVSQQTSLGESLAESLLGRIRTGLHSDQEEEICLCCELVAKTGRIDFIDRLRELIEDEEAPVRVRRSAVQALGELGQCDRASLRTLWVCSQTRDAALRHLALQTLLVLNDAPSAKTHTPAPVDLLLNALAGLAVEWEPNGGPQQGTGGEGTDDQLIPPVVVAESAASNPAELRQVLDTMSNAYPETMDEELSASPVNSTLEAIKRSNIEATVGRQVEDLGSDSERILGLVDALPGEYADYVELVHLNARTGERMLQKKLRKPVAITASRRILCARVLGDCDQASIVQPLLACLMDEEPELGREAAESLGRIAERVPDLSEIDNILGPVVTQLRAGSEEIRQACARTLGALKHEAAIPALFAALHDPDTLVRIQAIRSLTAISAVKRKVPAATDHTPVQEITPDSIVRSILGCRRDPEIGVRKAVIDALVALGYPDIDLLFSLGMEEGGALTPAAAQALKTLAPEAATHKLIRALDEIASSGIRRLVIQMLQEIHGHQAA